ncbi:MAG: enoyl-CoA hydratase-related protein [Dehalococcoidia bacterium]
MAEFKNVIYEKKGHLARITINRPDRLNAIDPETSREMHAAFSDFKEDDDLWVAILTGAGDKAFSAGADLKALAQAFMSGQTVPFDVPFGGITRDFQSNKPIIAAVNGFCLAGGLEIALACDIRIAAEHASFGLPEPKRAIMPAAGGSQRLPRMLPHSFAMEMLLTGERLDARDALRFGLVSRVVPANALMATAEEIAERILECGPLAVRATKQAALRGLDLSLEEGLALEAELAAQVFSSEDAREGPLAFMQKRKPEYKGR